MQEITDEVAGDVRVGMESKEHLRLEGVVFVVEPQRNRPDGRDLSPVASDWRNGRIRLLFRPTLGRYWDVPIRRFVDAEDDLAVGQLFLSCSPSSLSQRCFSSGSFSAAVALGLTGR